MKYSLLIIKKYKQSTENTAKQTSLIYHLQGFKISSRVKCLQTGPLATTKQENRQKLKESKM